MQIKQNLSQAGNKKIFVHFSGGPNCVARTKDENIECQHVSFSEPKLKLLDSRELVETHVLLISGNMNFAFI